MSGKQSGIVWDLALIASEGVSKDAKRSVLGAMADHADHDGNNVFPSIGLLAWKTELSTRQVIRVINALIEDKLILLIDERHNQYGTRHYKLTFANAPRKPAYVPKSAHATMSTAESAHDTDKSADDIGDSAHDKTKVAGDIRVSPYPSVQTSLDPSDKTGTGARPNIFKVYEQNIGLLTPMIADELTDAEKEYPPGWIDDAFKEAVTANVRKWNYVRAILERWKSGGRGTPKPLQTRGRSESVIDTLKRWEATNGDEINSDGNLGQDAIDLSATEFKRRGTG